MASLLNMSPEDFIFHENYIVTQEDDDSNDEPFSMWIAQEDKYTPAVKVKTIKKLPPGVYKITLNREGYTVNTCNISTDELYKFNEDTTVNVLNEIKDFWAKSDLYKKHNFVHKRGLLLQGPPGCGKTSVINLLIKEIIKLKGLVFIVNTINDFSVLSDALSSVVRTIEPETPIITIIEDIDQLITTNGNDAPFLDFLDGKYSINHHLVILTSNNTESLSSALIRPSRVDMLISLKNPNATTRYEYLQKKGFPKDQLQECVDKTEDFSFAQLKEIFVGVVILGKKIDTVIDQLKNPIKADFLNPEQKIGL